MPDEPVSAACCTECARAHELPDGSLALRAWGAEMTGLNGAESACMLAGEQASPRRYRCPGVGKQGQSITQLAPCNHATMQAACFLTMLIAVVAHSVRLQNEAQGGRGLFGNGRFLYWQEAPFLFLMCFLPGLIGDVSGDALAAGAVGALGRAWIARGERAGEMEQA